MQISYATLGFTIAGILFFVYSISFGKLPKGSLKTNLRVYSSAYLPLALVFLVWGLFTLNTVLLPLAVIIGNALLLIGSIIMMYFLFSERSEILRIILLIIGLLLSSIFLWWRIKYFFPTPYIINGILLLDTQQLVSIVWSVIFLLIWLPANLKAARIISRDLLKPEMNYIYSFIYIISTISAVLFISAQTPTLAIISFLLLLVSFVMLLYSNFVLKILFLEKGQIIQLPKAK